MKKTLFTGIFLTLLGAILFGIGLLHHGNQNLIWQNGGFQVENNSFSYKTFKTVKNFKLDTDDDIQIKAYDGKKVKVAYRANHNKVSYNKQQHAVTVTRRTDWGSSLVLGLGTFVPSKTIVYVPRNTKLNHLTGTADGNLTATDLNLTQVNLTSNNDVDLQNLTIKQELSLDGTANISLDSVKAPALNVNINDGNINIINSEFKSNPSAMDTKDGTINLQSSTFKQLHLTSSDGDINLNNLDVKGNINGQTSDGDINAYLPSRNHLKITADTVDGNCNIFGDDRTYYEHGSNPVFYTFKTSDGNISIK